ncbi:MAG: iron-sulfur cluster assembly scaffold protein [Spirochaetales bacterium]|nr:iron-sulfur cluster assembly scaffold protein [Spirochaetales bacterium]
MGKNDLIGGSLWDHYSNKVADRMNNPRNLGEISEEDAKAIGARLIVADWGAESCGDAVRLYWAVDEKTEKIVKGSFKSFGCGTAIASSDMMVELCLGKTVEEAMKITNLDVEKALRDNPDEPAVPPQKMHCSVMAYDVIKQAVAIYKGTDKEALDNQEMVCECAQVTLSTIKEVIRINNLKTVEEITEYTKAGAFCKSCIKPGGHEEKKYYLVDILKETRAEMELEREKEEAEKFENKSFFQKSKMIQAFFDAEIRPMLQSDGGDIDIVDIIDKGDTLELQVRYQGACHGCASSTAGTLYFIEGKVHEALSDKIDVAIV